MILSTIKTSTPTLIASLCLTAGLAAADAIKKQTPGYLSSVPKPTQSNNTPPKVVMDAKEVTKPGTVIPSFEQTKPIPKFVDLFNGKDLSGWVDVNTSPATWSVNNEGHLVCSGQPIGVMRSDRMYENFVLVVEWRHMQAGGNSGVFLWSDARPGKNRLPMGMEVQMLELEWPYIHARKDGTPQPLAYVHGELFGAGGMTATPDNPRGNRSKSLENRCLGKGQWNRYVIVAVDGTVKLSVNGKFVNSIRNASIRKGYLCLESEGAEIHFRKVSLMELPGGLADQSNTVPVVE